MTLSMTLEYHIKNIFIENHAENVKQKIVPDLLGTIILDLIILVNNPTQPLHARNYFKSKIF